MDKNDPSKKDQFYTVSQAAELLGVSPVTVWRWIEADKLPAFRVGPRNIRLKKEDLEKMIKPAKDKGGVYGQGNNTSGTYHKG